MNTHSALIRFGWLMKESAHPAGASIAGIFDDIAARTPDALAIATGRQGKDPADGLTYAELRDRAETLARALIEAGIEPGDRVGFATARNADLAVAMLGILKAGAAYVPIDLSYPENRIAYLVADSGIRAFVASPGLDALPDLPEIPVVATDAAPGNPARKLPKISPESTAYVIYTSGSTGKPKGVMTPHDAVLRLVLGTDYATFGPDRRVLQLAPVAFDAATFEIWGALLNGGSLVVYPDSGMPDLERLRGVIAGSGITTLWLTSALFNTVVDSDPAILAGIDEILVGGEALSVAHVRRAQAALPETRFINGYGPTETTTFACTYAIPGDLGEGETSIPIGRPIAGTAVAIVDESFRAVEEGDEGELVIAGDGLAVGYLDRPELTAERFVLDGGAPGGRFYRTGDIVRLRSDGQILFIGRRDTQVKIAGHRIELGEIEHALRAHPDLTDAAVTVEGTGTDKTLSAWTVAAPGATDPGTSALRSWLETRLPDYMIPARFTARDALPLTATGKLDRAALGTARRVRPMLDQAYAAPRGEMERYVAETWQRLIGLDRVGRHDRFFELGGTSILVMRFLEICRAEKGIALSVADFFDFPTVENVARLAEAKTETTPVTVVPVQKAAEEDRIAIVGVAGRFSGADDVQSFWDMLLAGGTGRVEITREDLIAAGEDPALLDDPDYVPAAYPLKDAEGFDADFFGFTPREIQLMDPQQRIMLECAWNALEDAGHDPGQSSDRIGVYGGVGRNAYMLNNLMSHRDLRASAAEYSMLIGNERDFPSTHIAFRLGLRGPAMTVQTGCSTSGVAIHLAAESLRRGECDLVLAGGAKVLVPNRVGYRWTEGGPVSPDGFIRAFDAGAGGMVRGSGCAMVAMKPLSKALEDGDHIYAVLISSAINNDGPARAGFTAPSAVGQAEAIAEAHLKAGINAESVTMIEAHGTGTVLGDPIEIEGLTRAFRTTTALTGYCAIGSVKTNIGHLDAGATAAGLIKAALSLKHEVIPPTINFETPNPRIPFDETPFFVAREVTPWARGDAPRRAGISSFGLGGTNAHILIEEAPVPAERAERKGPELLVVSARTDTALAQRCADLAERLEREPGLDLGDVAHTLRIGRRRFEKRVAMIVADREDAIAKLRAMNPRDRLRTGLAADAPPVAFLFPGGGAQYAGMARGLYEKNPAFKAALDTVSAHYEARTGRSLIDRILNDDTALENPSEALPALFAVEYATATLWQHWGVTPDAMIGHSMGEYTAACIAGVFSPEDAMDIVIARGRLFETLERGGMLSVPLSEAALAERLPEELAIAAVNRADQCAVSGPVAAIEAFEETLKADGIEARRIHIDVAAHSPMVEPILEEFRAAVEKATLNQPKIPFLSNLTGDWITDAEATSPDYWVGHLRGTVRFADGIERLLEDEERLFVEAGPGQTLATLTRQNPKRGAGHEVIASIRHPQEGQPDGEFLLAAAGRFWLAGGTLDWQAFSDGTRRRVPLPGYPFERKKLWIDAVPYGDTDADSQPFAKADAEARGPEAPEETETDPATRQERILARLTGVIQELSGLDSSRIDPHATFLELGFDSLFLTQANAAFKRAFKVKMTTRQLMEATPTLDLLATWLDENLAEDAAIGATPSAAPKPAATTGGAAVTGAAAPKADDSPGRPTIRRTSAELTPEQDAHIDELIAETTRRTPKAKASTQASRAVLADPRTVQGFRSRWKEMVYPVLSDSALGSKVWDVDGNEYIDLVGGYGVTFLGHRPDFVTQAIKDQLDKTLAIGPQAVLAGEVAGLVSEMTGMERVAFCNTGSEAVLAAVRMARTATGRSKIVKFDGHYHGIFDEMQVRGSGQGSRMTTLPAAPGIPAEAIQNTIIVQYGDPDAFEVIRENADDIALVLVEPVRSRNPDFQPKEYLQELRRITTECDVPLLFDEIVTGFRSHPGGAQEIFGVRADIATYGKVAGGGLPIGIVAGSARFMDTLDGGHWEYGDDSVPTSDMTWFAGTFVRHPMALAATKATLTHLKAKGPALQEGLNARAKKLAADLNAVFAAVNTPIRCEQFASVLRVTFTEHQDNADLLFFHLRNRGILTYEGRPIFLTTAHTEEDYARIVRAFDESVRALVAVGLLDGRDPTAIRRIPMATGQQEIWVTSKFSTEASCAYNLCSTLDLTGPLDHALLEAALGDLTERHEALRSVPDADGLTQTIQPSLAMPFEVHDLAGLDEAARAARVEELRQAEVTTPFDLAKGPLVRARLLVLGADRHLLLMTAHHVIADGWSCGVMVKEIGALYAARRDGTEADLAPAKQLGDYVGFLRQTDQREAREAARQYWIDLHKGDLPRVDFPADRARPRTRRYDAKRIWMDLDPALVTGLRGVAKANGTTLFATLIGGFAAYMGRLTGARDLPLGFSAAGQPLLGGGALVGHCVNFLPLRIATDPEAGFAANLKNAGGHVLDALEHQNFDFVSFVQEVRPERDGDWAPLIPIGVNLDPSSKGVTFADLGVKAGSVGRAYDTLDIFLNFAEIEDRVEMQCTFNLALFDEETIRRRLAEYLRLLGAGVADPDRPMGEHDLLSDAERDEIRRLGTGAKADYPRDKALPTLFRAVARRQAGMPALRLPGREGVTSYADLDAASDLWAVRLREEGVKKGDFVAVMLPRSADLIVAILGILKAGAAYVPIEPGTPEARIRLVLEDSGAQVLMSNDAPEGLGESLRVLRTADGARIPEGTAAPRTRIKGEDAAYMMYTSGSTGTPKGVVVPHRAIARLVMGTDIARLDEMTVTAMLAPASFDASTFEIWAALLNGGTVAIMPGTGLPELPELGRALRESGVTTLWLTASLFNTIIDTDPGILASVKEILTGGEALSAAHVRRALDALPEVRLVNGYGPTENTTFSCTWEVPRDFDGAASVPIGRPIANGRAHVVDAEGRLLPPGVPGELAVGGDGLAIGYWKRDDLTRSAFVSDTVTGDDGARLYRTGDICRMRADGTIDYLGRRDAQMKIRGFRIEPGEVEAAIASCPGVGTACVVASPENGGELLAFVTGSGLAEDTLRQALRQRLPRHMLPARILVLDALPVTGNGKADHRALLELAAKSVSDTGNIAPGTGTEHQLVQIWSEILKRDVTSVDQSFFDLGGHSLLAVRLFDLIRRRFGPDMPISTLFTYPTIRDLACEIDRQAGDPGASEDKSGDWDTSVVMHAGPGTGAKPIFIVGGAGGNLNNLADLARAIGETRPAIGFQSRGVLGHDMHDSIEDVAAEHIRYMRQHQPVGPYLLAGYSAGAQVAFEMARQLEAKGEGVSDLVLIDSFAPGIARTLAGGDPLSVEFKRPFAARIGHEARMLARFGLRSFTTRAKAKLMGTLLRGPVLAVLEPVAPTLVRTRRTLAHWFTLARRYQGGAYGGKAVLIVAKPAGLDEEIFLERYPRLGWDTFIDSARLDIAEIGEDHATMVEGEDASHLAGLIEARTAG